MKCEKCQTNEATFFYEETVNGKTKTYHLCRNCAAELRENGTLQFTLSDDTPFSLFPSMPDLLGGLFGLTAPQKRTSTAKTCPACGADWKTLAAKGKVCCPVCYETFGEELEATLRRIHGNVTHTGRAPALTRAVNEKKTRLANAKSELSRAIAEERFERAAELRDEIRTLESEKEEN